MVSNCLMLLTKVGESKTNNNKKNSGGEFKCKTCHRQFLSFQALGGHRASHKKINLIGASLNCSSSSTMKKRTKIHICPICGLQFAIGQALGGHMRKHRNSNSNINVNIHDHTKSSNGATSFDLNLTLFENDLKLHLSTPHVLNFLI